MEAENEAYAMHDLDIVDAPPEVGPHNDPDVPQRRRHRVRERPMVNFDDLDDRTRWHGMSLVSWTVLVCCWIFMVITFPILFIFYVKIVRQFESGVFTRFGYIIGRESRKGIHLVVPFVEKIHIVDRRLKMFDVPKQQMLTKDSLTIMIDAVVFYRVSDPCKALFSAYDYEEATHLLSQTMIRAILATYPLAGILRDRYLIVETLQKHLDNATNRWGVKVERLEMKDIRLPESMKFAMAAEAEAIRQVAAKERITEGELESSEILAVASRGLTSTAIELRYLEALQGMNNANLTVFPFPREMLSGLSMMSANQRMKK